MDQLSIGACIVPGMNQLLWYYADLEKKACQVKMFADFSLLELVFLNIAKGTTDPRVEFISQVITQILIKQFQNFD